MGAAGEGPLVQGAQDPKGQSEARHLSFERQEGCGGLGVEARPVSHAAPQVTLSPGRATP